MQTSFLNNTTVVCKLKIFILIIFFFEVVFDPSNTHFGLKTYSFLLFFILEFPFLNFSYIGVPLLSLMVFFISYAGALILNSSVDYGIVLWNFNSFLFLFLLLFAKDEKLKILKILYYVSLVFSIVIVFLAVSFLVIPFMNLIVTAIVHLNEDFIMFGYRGAYGLKYFCLYYRTSSICVIPEACALYMYFRTKKKKYFLHFLFFFFELFFSGARANMFSAIAIFIGCYISYLIFIKRSILFSYSCFLLFMFIGLYILLMLISEREHSNIVKLGHLESFFQLFNENPVRSLLFGFGPGAFMYSKGAGGYTSLTELSYMELIKSYGLLQTIFLLTSFCIPLIKLWIKKCSSFEKICFTMAYASFFFIAGTNPLFTGSTGFTTIIVMFYLCDKDNLKEFMKPKDKRRLVRNSFMLAYRSVC